MSPPSLVMKVTGSSIDIYSPQRIVFLKYYNQGMRKIALKTIFKLLNSLSQILIQNSAKVHFNFKNAGNEPCLYL